MDCCLLEMKSDIKLEIRLLKRRPLNYGIIRPISVGFSVLTAAEAHVLLGDEGLYSWSCKRESPAARAIVAGPAQPVMNT